MNSHQLQHKDSNKAGEDDDEAEDEEEKGVNVADLVSRTDIR